MLIRAIERSRPYLHFIVSQLEERGMPLELALVPIVESGFNPNAFPVRAPPDCGNLFPAQVQATA